MDNLNGYQITEKLEETKHSLLYRAQKSNKQVVIKLLKSDSPSPTQISRFIQEYNLIKNIEHENIIKTYDIIQVEKSFAIILEDFEGLSLKQFVSNGDIKLENLLKIAIKLAAALGYLHKNNIIHRDIKPNNILYNSFKDIVKITDFGISTILNDSDEVIEHSDMIIGTLAYISPEQTGRLNREVDYRSDLYSLGVTLYELLTGKLPFYSRDPLEMIHSHLAVSPTPLSYYRSELPSFLSDIVMKLLAKNPDERYQNGYGLAADLRKCLSIVNNEDIGKNFTLADRDIPYKFSIPEEIIGRDRELGYLTKSLESAFKGNKGVMLLTGEPGIGKSSLVCEVIDRFKSKESYIVSGSFEQFSGHTPYSAIIQAFEELIKQILTENSREIEIWKRKIVDSLGQNAKIIIDIIPKLELIIGKQPDVAELPPQDAKERFNMIFERFSSLFFSREHPLIIFLDNLQWSDPGSLQLVHKLLANPNNSYFFVILSYREKELANNRGAFKILEEIKRAVDELKKIELSPLSEKGVVKLVKGFIKSSRKVEELAHVVYLKTGGNPYFVKEFLNNLYNERLIKSDPEKGWYWDTQKIKDMKITDNLAELLAKKINKLEPELQDFLKVGACFGSSFDLDTLSAVMERSIEDTLGSMIEAVEEGIITFSNNNFCFLHNKLQEAAYSLISERDRIYYHNKIGRGCLSKTNGKELEERLFIIVDHLNKGVRASSVQEELDELIEFNLAAAKKAKRSIAYTSAYRYISKAFSLLKEDSWTESYHLTMSIYREIIELSFIKGNFHETDMLVERALSEAHTMEDKSNIYTVMIKAAIARNDSKRAIEIGVQRLKQLGYPTSFLKLHILIQFIKLKRNIKGTKIDTIAVLPDAVNQQRRAFTELFSTISNILYHKNNKLYVLCLIRSLNISLKYGATPLYPLAFIALGNLFISMFNNVVKGYELANKGMEMLRSYPPTSSGLAISYWFYNFLIRHWYEPAINSLAGLTKGYELGLSSGDFYYSAYNLWGFNQVAYFTGSELTWLMKNIQKDYKVIETLNQFHVLEHMKLIYQAVYNLRGASQETTKLKGLIINEEKELPRWLQYEERSIVITFYLIKLELSYLFNDYSAALTYSKQFRRFTPVINGLYEQKIYYFYYALAILALCPGQKFWERRATLLEVKKIMSLFKRWCRRVPEDNRHKLLLIEAEYYRVKGKFIKAESAYSGSIEEAKKNGYIQHEALAYELAGRHFLNRGNKEIARLYIEYAYNSYIKWGARAKAIQIEKSYPEQLNLFKKRHGENTGSFSIFSSLSGNVSNVIDLASVLKSFRAISSELSLEKVLNKMMTSILESAGAEKGYIILKENEELLVAAEGKEAGKDIEVLKPLNIEDYKGLSTAIVHYTAKTKENVIINDASTDKLFRNDPYILENRPKSILSIALKDKNKLRAVLYLENNLSIGAFTPERIEIIKLLASQAVISIENARLYDSIRASEEKYRSILTSMEDGYFELDLSRKMTFFNDSMCKILGIKRAELLNKEFDVRSRIVDAGILEMALKRVKAIKKTMKGLAVDIVKMDNSKISVEITLSPLLDREDRLAGYRGLCRDITVRKRTEELKLAKEVAEAANRAKSSFLAKISHDIRTPLNAIIGFAEMIGKSDCEESALNFSGPIIEQSNQLLNLINQLLDLSKIEAGKLEISTEPFKISSLLSSIDRSIGVICQKKGLNFYINYPSKLPGDLYGDYLRLYQVLMNLLGNAVKFTTEGDVTLNIMRLNDDGETVSFRFEIIDTGIGIPLSKKEEIYNIYQQADSKIAQQYGGTGLGLTISKQLIELMGGQLDFESVVDRGSTFFFELAFMKVNESNRKSDKEQQSYDPEEYKNAPILIVEDNKINQDIAKFRLTKAGFKNIEIADNGKAALDCFKKGKYDIILMDIQMPLMNGYDTAKEIRTIDPDIPIIGMTALAYDSEREECYKAGMNYVIIKPFQKEKFVSTVINWLAKSIKREEESEEQEEKKENEILPLNYRRALDELDGDHELCIELIFSLKDKIEESIEKIERAFKEGDFSALVFESHSLKGSCLNMSAQRLAEAALQVELEAKKDEFTNMNELISLIKEEAKLFDRYLEENLGLQMKKKDVKSVQK